MACYRFSRSIITMSLLIAAHLQVATWGIGDAEHPWHLHPVQFSPHHG